MPVTLPRLALLGALLFPVAAAWAAELRLELPGGTQTWSSEELLRHPQARDLDIPADVAYRRNMRYRAVPLAALLKGVHPEDHLQAVASDGFAAELPAAPLLAEQGSQAWLAIEDPQRRWAPASRPPGRSIWSGANPRKNASVRSNGPSRSSASATSPLWPNASRLCCRPPTPARKCAPASPCSRRTAWPATVSTVPATPSSART